MPELATLTTTFRRIAWRAKDSDFSFLQCDDATCKGDVLDPSELIPGLPYTFYGKDLPASEKYGRQFQFRQYVKAEPHTRNGVVAYLKRIGKLTDNQANKLFDTFENTATKVLRNDPEKCISILGPRANPEKIRWASAELRRVAATEDARIQLVELLHGRGFPAATVDQCIKQWGVHAANLIKRDPFRMLVQDISGAGFLRCDRIYMDLGLPPGKIRRQFFALWYALASGMDGNTWHPVSKAKEAIESSISGLAVEIIDWKKALRLGVKSGWLVQRTEPDGSVWIAEAEKAENEATIARVVRGLMKGEARWPEVMQIRGIDGHQRQVLSGPLQSRIAILAGTPGTGKSYAAAGTIEVLAERQPGSVAICAPTGKAAVRLNSFLVQRGTKAFATTIHRMLGVNRNGRDGKGWGFIFNERNRLPFKFYILEEGSMVDVDTFAAFLRALPDDAHLLLVGDPYQLPPVQHGAPFRDLIAAGVAYGELTEIKRNSGDLTLACRQIKDGKAWRPSDRIDIAAGLNLKSFETTSSQQTLAGVRNLVASAAAKDIDGKPINPIWDVQVITGLNEKSDIARKPLNELLQNVLNPNGERVKEHQFRKGDKVTCVKNVMLGVVSEAGEKVFVAESDDDGFSIHDRVNGNGKPEEKEQAKDLVANGEIGEVLIVESKSIVVRFETPSRCVRVPIGKQDEDSPGGGNGKATGSGCDFDLGYAISFHKSQGSQWPIVILVVDPAAYRIASRELWYTGLSRAEKLCLMIGPMAHAYQQCQRVELGRRKTFLKELIKATADWTLTTPREDANVPES